MTLNEFKLLTSICWNEKYQPVTIDMTKGKYQGRYRLGLNSTFVPSSSPFQELDIYKYIYNYTRGMRIIRLCSYYYT